MKLNVLFLVPAAVAGYFYGRLSDRSMASPDLLPPPRLSTAMPESAPPPPAAPARSEAEKEASVASVPPAAVTPASISKAFAEKSRVPRLLLLLDVISKCDQSDLKKNLEQTLDAFRNGLLGKSDLSLICEAAGGRCDPSLMVGLLSIPGIDTGLQTSLFKGWAETDPKGAVNALLTGKFQTADDKPHYQAIEGVLSGIDGAAPEIADIRRKFSQYASYIDKFATTASVRQYGMAKTIQAALELPVKLEVTEITHKLAALADLAGEISDEAFLKYVNSTVKSGKDLALNAAMVGKKFAERNYTQSFEYGLTLPPGDTRSNFLSTSVFQAGMKNPDDAIKLVAEMPAGSRDEQYRIIRSLENAFRQSPAVSKAELPDLMRQTQTLMNSLKPK